MHPEESKQAQVSQAAIENIGAENEKEESKTHGEAE